MATYHQDPAQEQGDDGRPTDIEAYGWAAHRRDRSMWAAYVPVRSTVGTLLATATAQLDLLPQEARPAWASKITALARAADTLETHHDRLISELRDHLVHSNAPALISIDVSMTEFFDEAWSALHVWASGGHAVIELNTMVGSASTPPPQPALRLLNGGVASPPRGQGPARGGRC
ncbi:hypothetical protein ABZ714_11365 [Streptomyces sp. NPDC006798]|uniref:hypothetical protein n=1 Tax=Streptomyces sp. NPDC006798 TaxID=3155462 RepID=UPI0034119209